MRKSIDEKSKRRSPNYEADRGPLTASQRFSSMKYLARMNASISPVARSQPMSDAAFLAKGIASLENAIQTDDYVDVEVVIGNLQRRLEVAKAKQVLRNG